MVQNGCAGHNIPVDLHIEHLNRRLKGMMRGLGSNITPESIQQASKSLGIIEAVCSNFEEVSNIIPNKDYHSMPSFDSNLQKLKKQLVVKEVCLSSKRVGAIKDLANMTNYSHEEDD